MRLRDHLYSLISISDVFKRNRLSLPGALWKVIVAVLRLLTRVLLEAMAMRTSPEALLLLVVELTGAEATGRTVIVGAGPERRDPMVTDVTGLWPRDLVRPRANEYVVREEVREVTPAIPTEMVILWMRAQSRINLRW